MTIKERIEKILPEPISPIAGDYGDGYNVGIGYCKEKLMQALSEGKLCLDPPSREELEKIIAEHPRFTIYALADLILSRIRNGREE